MTTIAATGTHDNNTSRGWFEGLDVGERAQVLGTVGGDGREIEWDMIRVALDSPARTAIIPMQDVLGLGSEHRMNRPGETKGNWVWRLKPGQPDADAGARLRALAERCGRV